MSNVIGISALYHDAACCLVQDGHLVVAAQEERFTRMKFDPGVPVNSFTFCLDAAKLTPPEVDCIAYYENPTTKLARIAWSLSVGIGDLRSVVEYWEEKLHTRALLAHKLNFAGTLRLYDHHLCHCASAYYCSPFEEAAILTTDGVGEWATTMLAIGSGGVISSLDQINFPHSLGLFYSAITSFLGFTPNSDEYKVMGLAAFGAPKYLSRLKRLINYDERGFFTLDMNYFDYNKRMYSEAMADLLGLPPRARDGEVLGEHADVACSAQKLLEEVLILLARHLHVMSGLTDLCLAGGVALNCVANSRLRVETPFRRLYVQPAAGDAGGAIGAAMLAYHELLDQPYVHHPMRHAYLGPSYSVEEIRRYLNHVGVRYHDLSEEEMLARTAAALESGKIVGWFQGAMEFGPRALGARSILADARRGEMKDLLNAKIKKREEFRPFAPVCLSEKAPLFFDCAEEHPFMTFTVPVRDRNALPAISHVDGTARLQTVGSATAERLAKLLKCFESRTGVPVLINTSFNIAGEPIVCSPADAFNCFRESGMDILVLETLMIDRQEQNPSLVAAGSQPYFSLAREIEPYLRDTYFFS